MNNEFPSNNQRGGYTNNRLPNTNVTSSSSISRHTLPSQMIFGRPGNQPEIRSHQDNIINNNPLFRLPSYNQFGMNQVQPEQPPLIVNTVQNRVPYDYQSYQTHQNINPLINQPGIGYHRMPSNVPPQFPQIVPIYNPQVVAFNRNDLNFVNPGFINIRNVNSANIYNQIGQSNQPEYLSSNQNNESVTSIPSFTALMESLTYSFQNTVNYKNTKNISSNENCRDDGSNEIYLLLQNLENNKNGSDITLNEVENMESEKFIDLTKSMMKKMASFIQNNLSFEEFSKFCSSSEFLSVFRRLSIISEPIITTEEDEKEESSSQDHEEKKNRGNVTKKEKNSLAAKQSRKKRKIRNKKSDMLNEYLLKENRLFEDFAKQLTTLLFYFNKKNNQP